MFKDRVDAGQQLAEKLRRYCQEKKIDLPKTVVASIPRGGVVVGKIVAEALGLRHEIIIAKKLRAPGQPELAIGAVAEDGAPHMANSYTASEIVDTHYLHQETVRVRQEMETLSKRIRSGLRPQVRGKTVFLVDDGIATGETMRAAADWVRQHGGQPLAAAPVGAVDTCHTLRQSGLPVVAVLEPTNLRSIGQYYRQFAQVEM